MKSFEFDAHSLAIRAIDVFVRFEAFDAIVARNYFIEFFFVPIRSTHGALFSFVVVLFVLDEDFETFYVKVMAAGIGTKINSFVGV